MNGATAPSLALALRQNRLILADIVGAGLQTKVRGLRVCTLNILLADERWCIPCGTGSRHQCYPELICGTRGSHRFLWERLLKQSWTQQVLGGA